MNYRISNIVIILSICFSFFNCNTENITRTLNEEMKARKCSSEAYNLTIQNIDSISLIKRYSNIPNFHFNEDYMKVVANGKMGLIDTLGREIIKPFYDKISHSPGRNFKIGSREVYDYSEATIWKKPRRYTEIDLLYIGDNDSIYKCKCEKINRLYTGQYETTVGGNYGLLDSLGRELLPPIYGIIYGVGENGLVSANLDKGDGGIINLENKVIVPFNYSRVWDFGNRNITPIENLDGKWAIVSDLGNFKTSFIYDDIEPYNKTNTTTVTKSNKKALLDKYGNLITSFKYDQIWNYSSSVQKIGEVYYIPIVLNNKWGILTSTGKELVSPLYDKKIKRNLPTAVSRENLWTFINKDGKEIVPASFEEILYPENEIIGLKKNKKWGVVSSNGAFLSDHIYDNFYSSSKSKYSYVTKNKKYNVINSKGKVFISEMDSIKIIFQDTQYGFTSYKDGKWGVIDSLGEKNIPFIFDELGLMRFKNGFAKKGTKYGIISYLNTIILPFEYDYIGEFEVIADEISAPIRLNKKWGRIDINGNITKPIIHSSYEEIEINWDGC